MLSFIICNLQSRTFSDWDNYENFKSGNTTDGEELTVQRKQRKQVFIFKINENMSKILNWRKEMISPYHGITLSKYTYFLQKIFHFSWSADWFIPGFQILGMITVQILKDSTICIFFPTTLLCYRTEQHTFNLVSAQDLAGVS